MVNFNLRAKNGSYHFNKTVILKKKTQRGIWDRAVCSSQSLKY